MLRFPERGTRDNRLRMLVILTHSFLLYLIATAHVRRDKKIEVKRWCGRFVCAIGIKRIFLEFDRVFSMFG